MPESGQNCQKQGSKLTGAIGPRIFQTVPRFCRSGAQRAPTFPNLLHLWFLIYRFGPLGFGLGPQVFKMEFRALQKAHLHAKTFHLILFQGTCIYENSVTKTEPGKESMTDRQTDGHPKSVGPDLWGWGLININTVSANSIISQISTNIALSPYTMVAWKALPSIVKYSSRVHRAFYHLPSKKKMIYKFLAMRGGVMSQTFHLLIYYCDDFRY